jgi:hypothetical protein
MGGYLAPVPFFFHTKHKSNYFLGIEKTVFFLQILRRFVVENYTVRISICVSFTSYFCPPMLRWLGVIAMSIVRQYVSPLRIGFRIIICFFEIGEKWKKKKNKTALPKELIIICIYLWNMSTKVWNHHYFKINTFGSQMGTFCIVFTSICR